jgi:Mo-co oxidoreductase dimerisation domain
LCDFASVGSARLKSAAAKVTRVDDQYRIIGAAWGGEIEKVEVRIDDGKWTAAKIDNSETAEFAWKIWSVDSIALSAGEHSVTSRAIDTQGRIQPAMDDPWIANKHTYWESNGQVTRQIRIA